MDILNLINQEAVNLTRRLCISLVLLSLLFTAKLRINMQNVLAEQLLLCLCFSPIKNSVKFN